MKRFLLVLTLFCFIFQQECLAEDNVVLEYKNESYFEIQLASIKKEIEDYKQKYEVLKIKELILMSNPKISKKDKTNFIDSILKWSDYYNLKPLYVASIIHRESNFKNNYVSKNGMYGPMQVHVKAHKKLLNGLGIEKEKVKFIDSSIQVGCYIIKDYINKTGCKYKALYRYVGSPSAHWYVERVKETYNSYAIK